MYVYQYIRSVLCEEGFRRRELGRRIPVPGWGTLQLIGSVKGTHRLWLDMRKDCTYVIFSLGTLLPQEGDCVEESRYADWVMVHKATRKETPCPRTFHVNAGSLCHCSSATWSEMTQLTRSLWLAGSGTKI